MPTKNTYPDKPAQQHAQPITTPPTPNLIPDAKATGISSGSTKDGKASSVNTRNARPPLPTTLPPAPPTKNHIFTTFNIAGKFDVLLGLLQTVQPTILFVQEAPFMSSELAHLAVLMPHHFIHYTENEKRGHLSLIHQTWAHFLVNHDRDIISTSRTHQFTFRFPNCPPLTLCNVYGSIVADEREDLKRELADIATANGSLGDWNATYKSSHSSTTDKYNNGKLQWTYLKERLIPGFESGENKGKQAKGKKAKQKEQETKDMSKITPWMDAWEICNPNKEVFTRIRNYGVSQSRLDFAFFSPQALEILYPEIGYMTDIDLGPGKPRSDHVAVTIHFSSPILPAAQPDMPHRKQPKNQSMFPFSAISESSIAALKNVIPKYTMDDYNRMTTTEKERVKKETMGTLAATVSPKPKLTQPQWRTPPSQSHQLFLNAFQKYIKWHPRQRLPTAIEKFLRPHVSIQTLMDPVTEVYLTEEELENHTTSGIKSFGTPTSAPDQDTNASNWPGPDIDHASSSQTQPPQPIFKFSEFIEIAKKSPKDKVCGDDRFPTRAIAECHPDMQEFLHNILVQHMIEPLPSLSDTIITLIHKDGNPFLLSNYRPISLTSCLYRLYTKWLNDSLLTSLLEKIHTSQYGFLPGRHIHVQILRIMNALASTKDAYLVLFDIKKAYDSVDLQLLWKRMKQYNIPDWLIERIQDLYRPSFFRVKLANGLTKRCQQNENMGLRQGCSLSPLLFLLYIDPLLRQLANHKVPMSTLPPSCNIHPTHGGFADDIGVVANKDTLPGILELVANFCEDHGLELNLKKTEIMSFAHKPKLKVLPLLSWRITTKRGNILTFKELDSHQAGPLRYLGVYVHPSEQKIANKILDEVTTKLQKFSVMKLTPAQSQGIIHLVLNPLVTHRLVVYPLLKWQTPTNKTQDVSIQAEKRFASFMLAHECSTMSEAIHYAPLIHGGSGTQCLHARTQKRNMDLMFSILTRGTKDYSAATQPLTTQNIPEDVARCFFLRSLNFREEGPMASVIPFLDPIKTLKKLHELHGISSILHRPQPKITEFFKPNKVKGLPDGVVCRAGTKDMEQTFHTKAPDSCEINRIRDTDTLKKHGCMEALSLMDLAEKSTTQCYATDGSKIGNTAGYAVVNTKTGDIIMRPTTGHLSSGRGEWLAALEALKIANEDQPLIIYTDYHQITRLTDYVKNPKSLSKCRHRDLIAKAAHRFRCRPKGSTHICYVKGHAGILANTTADHYARMACELPRPKHDPTCPTDWAIFGLPITLPVASSLIPIREHYHRCTMNELPHDTDGNLTINMYLSTLPSLTRSNPKQSMHFYGRGTWEGFQFWNKYKELDSLPCVLCGTSHPQDIYTSMAVCPQLEETRMALADGYGQEIGTEVAAWMRHGQTPKGDVRNATRNHVPVSLVQFLAPKKLLPAFTVARKRYEYMRILKVQHEKINVKLEKAQVIADLTQNPNKLSHNMTTHTKSPYTLPKNPNIKLLNKHSLDKDQSKITSYSGFIGPMEKKQKDNEIPSTTSEADGDSMMAEAALLLMEALEGQ